MKTLLLSLSFVFFSGLAFGQSKKNYTKQELTKMTNKSYFPADPVAVSFYECMNKNYKKDPKKFPEFMSTKEFDKKYPNKTDIEKNNIFERESLHFRAYGLLNYQSRIGTQASYPKCIKKSDIDW